MRQHDASLICENLLNLRLKPSTRLWLGNGEIEIGVRVRFVVEGVENLYRQIISKLVACVLELSADKPRTFNMDLPIHEYGR